MSGRPPRAPVRQLARPRPYRARRRLSRSSPRFEVVARLCRRSRKPPRKLPPPVSRSRPTRSGGTNELRGDAARRSIQTNGLVARDRERHSRKARAFSESSRRRVDDVRRIDGGHTRRSGGGAERDDFSRTSRCGIAASARGRRTRAPGAERDGLAYRPDMVIFTTINDRRLIIDGRGMDGHTDRELSNPETDACRPIRDGVPRQERFYDGSDSRSLAGLRTLAPALERPVVKAAVRRAIPRRRTRRGFRERSLTRAAAKPQFPWDSSPRRRRDRGVWPDTLPYLENTNLLCRVPDADRARILEALWRTLEERGIDLVLIHPAYRSSRPHRCVLTEFAARGGIPVVEFERLVWLLGETKKWNIFIDTYHPTAVGHALLAEELARVVRPRIPSPGDERAQLEGRVRGPWSERQASVGCVPARRGGWFALSSSDEERPSR